MRANQIVIAENSHASVFSHIATSRELLRRQLGIIKSSRPTILASGREVNNLPLAARLAGVRRVDPLTVIPSQTSVTIQELRRVIVVNVLHVSNILHLNVVPPGVEPRSHDLSIHPPLLLLMANLQPQTVKIHFYYLNFHIQIMIAMLIPILTLSLILNK